jgi:tRNA(fMet)-specific endonuclease VapC
MTHLLDTNICIYIINKKPRGVVERIRGHEPGDIAISSLTVAELTYGVERSRHPDRNRVALVEFLFPFTILDFDSSAAQDFGRIRHSLEATGTPIGPVDLLLSAQARSRNLVFVTNNAREFKRIPGLRTENWARA